MNLKITELLKEIFKDALLDANLDYNLKVSILKIKDIEKSIQEIEKDIKLLRALEAAGVDNWEGYDEAVEIL